MRVSDFDFHLPPDRIAQHPPAERDAARMLTLDRRTGALADRTFRDLPDLLHKGDLLILNNSRVIPARLFATRAGLRTQTNSPAPTGEIEVLLTQQLTPTDWRALVKPARKVQPRETLHFHNHLQESHTPQPAPDLAANAAEPPRSPRSPRIRSSPEPASGLAASNPTLTAEVLDFGDFGERTLRFSPTENFFEALNQLGHIPLPPYLHRPDTPEDRARYQTVYAGEHTHGSAAAPTAGLHFTPAILDQIRDRGVEIQHITLHVGLGTFQPVRVDKLSDIRLHEELYTLPEATAQAINRARAEGRRIIAAGTTTVRTLEHCAAQANADPTRPTLPNSTQRELHPHSGQTGIFLSPGHPFALVDALLTNFHLPQSTLLMLVCAFAGTGPVLTAYNHAVQHGYRFFSYGDCMFLS